MRKEYILNPIFALSLLLLVLNDFIFKVEFSNFVTGKLSDFSGITVFTLFLMIFFSNNKKHVFIFVILFFSFWKSSLSSPFIEFINQIPNLNYVRIVDYSDLIALIVLIPLNFYEPQKIQFKKYKFLAFNSLFGLSIFAMFATSRGNMRDYGRVFIGETIKYKASKTGFLSTLNQNGITYKLKNKYLDKKDSIFDYSLSKFTINSDTIYNADISIKQLREEKIAVNLRSIYITENGKPLEVQNYTTRDSIINSYKTKTIDYFKAMK
ncbi:MAG: hypothetical protein ACK5B9_08815 [Flavobacteriia bacterium]|jgi:hypothetical protein